MGDRDVCKVTITRMHQNILELSRTFGFGDGALGIVLRLAFDGKSK